MYLNLTGLLNQEDITFVGPDPTLQNFILKGDHAIDFLPYIYGICYKFHKYGVGAVRTFDY
jgi:hypothetical protein